jgi:hypothetical protein
VRASVQTPVIPPQKKKKKEKEKEKREIIQTVG